MRGSTIFRIMAIIFILPLISLSIISGLNWGLVFIFYIASFSALIISVVYKVGESLYDEIWIKGEMKE